MIRRLLSCILVTAAIAGASAQSAPGAPAPLFYYAGQPGRLTQDRDRLGGNPFASALIEVLKAQPATLKEFTGNLAAANARHSGGWQQLQFPKSLPVWRMDATGETRLALVLINSDYSKSSAGSLPGAARDAQRIPEALRSAGFDVTAVIDQSTVEARKALAEFAGRSAKADAALIYVGGHGVQHARQVYWMMGEYPEQDSKWLGTYAIALTEIGASAHARGVNLVLYASCRDDPFQGK